MQPLDIISNYPLRELNTFGLDVCAERYFKLSHRRQIKQALAEVDRAERSLILGGGSNVLFLGNYGGTIVHIDLKGRELVEQNKQHVYLKLGGGEVWHDVVMFCIANGWGGLESLSLIPGTVGAAPIQNIGAYGAELQDTFHELEAVELGSGKTRTFSKTDCSFGYRDSLFKRAGKNRFLISSVTLRLNLNSEITITHEGVRQQLGKMKVSSPDIKDISDAVIKIRQKKLPDPAEIGNGGSFFKNPIIADESYRTLKESHPSIPCYRISETRVKVPAGWLIEQAGWKGRIIKDRCGVHARQALVLVNYGNASGQDILKLSTDIVKSVEDTFGISLVREVNVIE